MEDFVLDQKKNKISFGQLLFIQGAVIIISLGSVFQKLAAGFPPLSFMFLFYYACSLAVLFVYAILWQIILKRVPLTVAYSNRALSTIWALVWGVVLFHEHVGWNHIVGAVVICIGVYLVTAGGADSD